MQPNQTEITSSKITDNQTWNDCPNCMKCWPDKVATPGIIHRTRLCDACKKTNRTNN